MQTLLLSMQTLLRFMYIFFVRRKVMYIFFESCIFLNKNIISPALGYKKAICILSDGLKRFCEKSRFTNEQ
jgi:hypothetical protein